MEIALDEISNYGAALGLSSPWPCPLSAYNTISVQYKWPLIGEGPVEMEFNKDVDDIIYQFGCWAWKLWPLSKYFSWFIYSFMRYLMPYVRG